MLLGELDYNSFCTNVWLRLGCSTKQPIMAVQYFLAGEGLVPSGFKGMKQAVVNVDDANAAADADAGVKPNGCWW